MDPHIRDLAMRPDRVPLVSGVVYKTHALPGHTPRHRKLKVLFTYRRATEVAMSIAACANWYGPKWFATHRKNMYGTGEYDAFLRGDTLGLESQIDQWMAAEGLDILGVNYRSLWDRKADIEGFLGFPLQLPDRKGSGGQAVPPQEVELIHQTYAALDRKIDGLPDMFLRRA